MIPRKFAVGHPKVVCKASENRVQVSNDLFQIHGTAAASDRFDLVFRRIDLHYASLEKHFDQFQNAPIFHSLADARDNQAMIQAVETFGQVHIDYPFPLILADEQRSFRNGHLARTAGMPRCL